MDYLLAAAAFLVFLAATAWAWLVAACGLRRRCLHGALLALPDLAHLYGQLLKSSAGVGKELLPAGAQQA